jgi:hypothetical protein
MAVNNFAPQIDIISTQYLDTFTYTFNGVPYSYYDSGLILMYNFDNVAALGESQGIIKDASQYGTHGTGYGGIAWTANGKLFAAIPAHGAGLEPVKKTFGVVVSIVNGLTSKVLLILPTASVTLIVQLLWRPVLKTLNVIRLLLIVAVVSLEEQSPP